MLLGVAAAVYAFERREIIRQTWGTYAETEKVKVGRVCFQMLGVTNI